MNETALYLEKADEALIDKEKKQFRYKQKFLRCEE